MKSTATHQLTITVVDDAGMTAAVQINENVPLSQLLRRGLKALYRDRDVKPDDYDLLISGVVQEDLGRSLRDAGLVSGAEVAILRKDLPRGS